jgi:hypothetical protein
MEMNIGLKFFALCLAAVLIGAAPAQKKPEAWQVVKYAKIYVCMVHGYTQAHLVKDLIFGYGDRRLVSVLADSREFVEDFINAGFDVWTSDDGTADMRFRGSQIIVDDKYIIDWRGNVIEDAHAADVLSWKLIHFCDDRAKKQYPKAKKPTPTQKPVPKKPTPAKK